MSHPVQPQKLQSFINFKPCPPLFQPTSDWDVCRGRDKHSGCPLSSLFFLSVPHSVSSCHLQPIHSWCIGMGRRQGMEPLTIRVELSLARELPRGGDYSQMTFTLAAVLVTQELCIAGNLSVIKPLMRMSILCLASPLAPCLWYSPSLDEVNCPTSGPPGHSPARTT